MCLGNANTYYATGAGGTSIVSCTGGGAVCLGGAYTRYDGTAKIDAGGFGAFVLGYANSYYADSDATVYAYGSGSFASGYISSITGNADIYGYGKGSWSGGVVTAGFELTEYGLIEAFGDGSFAHGWAYARGGNVEATIRSTGVGSFAHGYADSTDIIALADNSVQFGPGTNDEENSLQVGTGIRINGTLGIPGNLKNGDVWLVGTDVFIRSGGVSVQIT